MKFHQISAGHLKIMVLNFSLHFENLITLFGKFSLLKSYMLLVNTTFGFRGLSKKTLADVEKVNTNRTSIKQKAFRKEHQILQLILDFSHRII